LEKDDVESINGEGLYDHVRFEHHRANSFNPNIALTDLRINISEKKNGGFKLRLSSGYDQEKFGWDLSYSERNIYGSNQSITLSLKMNPEKLCYKFIYIDPWTKVCSRRINRSLLVLNTINYSCWNQHQSGSIGWSRPINHFWEINWGSMIETRKDLEISKSKTDDQMSLRKNGKTDQKIRDWTSSLSTLVTYKKSNPDDYFSINFKKIVLHPSISFAKADRPILSGMNYHWSQETRVGCISFVTNLQSFVIIHSIYGETFFFNKTNFSIRGQSKNSIDLDRLSSIASAELKFGFTDQIFGVLFSDFGSGCVNSGWGLGCGIKLISPIGPLRFDCTLNDLHKCSFHITTD
jgi:outer membrane protein assembly factor BamA